MVHISQYSIHVESPPHVPQGYVCSLHTCTLYIYMYSVYMYMWVYVYPDVNVTKLINRLSFSMLITRGLLCSVTWLAAATSSFRLMILLGIESIPTHIITCVHLLMQISWLYTCIASIPGFHTFLYIVLIL